MVLEIFHPFAGLFFLIAYSWETSIPVSMSTHPKMALPDRSSCKMIHPPRAATTDSRHRIMAAWEAGLFFCPKICRE
jgi:hypothetical protein